MAVVQRLTTSQQQPVVQERVSFPTAGLEFDRCVALLSTFFVMGIFLDGWAHNHGKVDATFFTIWHAVLYSGYAILGAFLSLSMRRFMLQGFSMQQSLPKGYLASYVGVFIFALAGAADFAWHTLFGFEISVEAVLSPTHLLLALGAILMIMGPWRATWQRLNDGTRVSWVSSGPMLLSMTLTLSVLTFFTQYASPLVINRPITDAVARSAHNDLYVMKLASGIQLRIPVDTANVPERVAISPDGSTLAFLADGGIYVVRSSGGTVRRLAANADRITAVNWMPDGSRLGFVAGNNSDKSLFTMNPDGSNMMKIIDLRGDVAAFSWASTNNRLAVGINNGGTAALYMVSSDVPGMVQIATATGELTGLSWSTHETSIVFGVDVDGVGAVYQVVSSGGNLTKLPVDLAESPAFTPDGHLIVASARDGNSDLYLVSTNGESMTNLTNNPAIDAGMLSISTDGDTVAFIGVGHSLGIGFLRQALGVTSILFQTSLLMGILLLVVSRWPIPLGGFTLLLAVNGLLMSVLNDQYFLLPGIVIAGVIGDLLIRCLRPSIKRRIALYMFAFVAPMIVSTALFVGLFAMRGIAWSVHLWTGSIIISGVVGLFVAFLMAPPFDAAIRTE